MARTIDRKINQIEGVAAGQTAVIKLPIGLTYHRLTIPYSGVTLAQMDEIRVVANGDVLMRYVGADLLNVVNQFDRKASASGIIRLDFERYNLLTRPGIEQTVIGTGLPAGTEDGRDPRKITDLRVEIDIASAATAPSINNVRAKLSGPRPSGTLLRVQQQTYEFGGSGEFEIDDLKIVGGRINRVIFRTGDIDRLRLDVDGREVFDRRSADNELVQNDGIRTPQAGHYVLDTTEVGYGGDYIDVRGAQDVRWTLNLSGAATFAVIVETLDMVRA